MAPNLSNRDPKKDELIDRITNSTGFGILNEHLNRVVRIAARLFEAPIALITVLDAAQDWTTAHTGLGTPAPTQELPFSFFIMGRLGTLVIPDASKDGRFSGNPLVVNDPKIRFYAGTPLRTASGAVVGTLCVADPQARLVTEKHSAMLEDLAFSVSTSLELVKTVRQMHNQGGALELELGRKLRRLHDNVEELEQWGHKLEESHEKLSHFLSSGSDVLWETDPDLRIVSAKGFSGVEWNENSFIGQRLAETLGAYIEHNSEAKLLVEQLETRQPFRDITFVHSLGEERTRWLEASANPVFTSTGTFRGYRGTFRDITRRKEDEARISFLARHDVLTRLPNRTVLRERIEHALAQSHRGGHFAVHWLDLDRFKAINDTLGHATGDRLLQVVGERISSCIREIDTVARLGGDEFAIVQVGLERPAQADMLARRLVDIIQEPCDIDGHSVTVEASIGIVMGPGGFADADAILKSADIALYRAKGDGRGTYRFFEAEMDALAQANRLLETDLRRALKNGEFRVLYQPVFNMQSKEISGVEALLRWKHPVRGMLLPEEFLAIAEEKGLIVSIGEWVLRQACAQAVNWPPQLTVSVNLSPLQFKSRKLVPMIQDVLRETRLSPSRLELEVTESAVMENDEMHIAILQELLKAGVLVSLDDFGTRYSSISCLRQFRFHKVKIDHSFVHQLSRESDSIAVVRAILGLCKSFGVRTTAEGVETLEQYDWLQAEGCTEIQGSFFSPPVAADTLLQLLVEKDATNETPKEK